MPDDSPVPSHPYLKNLSKKLGNYFPGFRKSSFLHLEKWIPSNFRIGTKWIPLAAALFLIFLSVDFFVNFSKSLASQKGGEEQAQPGLTPDGQEVYLPDRPGPKEPLSMAVGKVVAFRWPLNLPHNPPPGTVKVSPIDGMKLIYIPASKIRMGANVRIRRPGDIVKFGPVVRLDAFWISQTQVTNAMYARCVAAGGCRKAMRKSINPHYYDPKFADHPVVYVTWSDALGYCKFTGGRLPTEAEWEKAAGEDGERIFPWGDPGPVSRRANVANHKQTTTPVGSYPLGATRLGVLDMGGNVREWVADWFSEYYNLQPPYNNPSGPEKGKLRVLKGASWHDSVNSAMLAARFAHLPESAGNNRGFRCAFSP